jgi:positive regulator of sigma E activity
MSSTIREVKHKGRVTAVTPQIISVEIIDRSICSGCNAKGFCSASESKIKVIEVKNRYDNDFSIGEEVNIIMRTVLGLKAVLISYVIPLFILLILLLSLSEFGFSELLSGLVAIGAVGIYFCIVFLCRNRLAGGFDFTISKINI